MKNGTCVHCCLLHHLLMQTSQTERDREREWPHLSDNGTIPLTLARMRSFATRATALTHPPPLEPRHQCFKCKHANTHQLQSSDDTPIPLTMDETKNKQEQTNKPTHTSSSTPLAPTCTHANMHTYKHTSEHQLQSSDNEPRSRMLFR